MRSWKALCGLALLMAGTMSWQVTALAQTTADARSPVAGEHLDDRPAYPSIVNSAVWPQQKKDRETEFEASVVIQVDGDANFSQMASPTVALLTTSALVENAATKAFGMDRPKVRESLQVIASGAGLRMTRLEVRLLKTPGVEWKDGDAQKLIDALADGLRAALNQSANAAARLGEEAQQRREAELAASNQKLADVRAQQSQLRQKLSEIPAQFLDRNLGGRNAADELQMVQQQIRQYEEQLASKNPAATALLTEWEELVKLREEKLEQLKEEKRPASEVKDAEIQLAEARAKLASSQTGTDRFPRPDVADVARLKSRIEPLRKREDELKALTAKLNSPELQEWFEKQQQLATAEETLRNETMIARTTGSQWRRQAPSGFIVTILDGREN
jgi:hypothetical protein